MKFVNSWDLELGFVKRKSCQFANNGKTGVSAEGFNNRFKFSLAIFLLVLLFQVTLIIPSLQVLKTYPAFYQGSYSSIIMLSITQISWRLAMWTLRHSLLIRVESHLSQLIFVNMKSNFFKSIYLTFNNSTCFGPAWPLFSCKLNTFATRANGVNL